MKRTLFVSGLMVACGAFFVLNAEARPPYARQTNKPCGYCHVSARGGGERNFRGMYYGANALSFQSYDEQREAFIAGVLADSDGRASKPTRAYVGSVSGPAAPQIQLMSLNGPVLVVFFDGAGKDAQQAAKTMDALAGALGTRAGVLGVVRGDTAKALSFTKDLGSKVRVLPDPEGKAIAKFKAEQGLDLVLLDKLGDPLKSWSGFSRSAIEEALAVLKGKRIEANVDLAGVPEKALRGGKL